jgi:outer membrane protein assembly factor BamB
MSAYRSSDPISELVFVAFNGRIFAMDGVTGERKWVHDFDVRRSVRLVVRDDRIIALALRARLSCLDAAGGRVAWTTEQMDGDTLLVDGNRVFIGGGGEVQCLDATTGKLLWRDGFEGMGLGQVAIAVAGQAAQADETG